MHSAALGPIEPTDEVLGYLGTFPHEDRELLYARTLASGVWVRKSWWFDWYLVDRIEDGRVFLAAHPTIAYELHALRFPPLTAL